jgi:hypothetical protein
MNARQNLEKVNSLIQFIEKNLKNETASGLHQNLIMNKLYFLGMRDILEYIDQQDVIAGMIDLNEKSIMKEYAKGD